VVSLLTPDQFRAVGDWYDEFNQTTDDEVTSLLRSATPEVAQEVDEEKH
jgi:predicted phosphoribosyltransferase